MKKQYCYFIFLVFALFFSSVDNIFAQQKTCEYEYYKTKSYGEYGEIANASDATIYITIYDDQSHKGTSETTNGSLSGFNPGGDEQLKNWGEDFNGVSDIKGSECPNYVGVTNTEGIFEAATRWYGFNDTEEANSINDRVTIFIRKDFTPSGDTYLRCEYDNFSIGIDYANKKVEVSSNLTSTNIFYYETESLEKYWFEDRKEKKCVAVYSCSEVVLAGTNSYIYQDTFSAYSDGRKDCTLNCLKDDESCEQTDCPTITLFLQDLDYYYYDYSENDNISSLIEADRLIEENASICNTMLSNLDYNEPCASECLKFRDYVQEKKDYYEISDNVDGDCGLSARLIVWISNILRWVKYILPVAVIILGILDFIKAIGTDKDDEMKKAQQRFIRRLISAALVFLIPLILEFVLDKMGFGYDSCSLL